ncbi:MoaD/ThiS family protein [Nakamurella silvestris]|nr:MoaD/ThiS family protein [Nakamurella silvestris]
MSDRASTATTSGTAVLVRYFAAARAATGIDEETVTVPAPASVATVLAALGARHGSGLAQVLDRCSFLLNEVVVGDPSRAVGAGDAIDVLPPFAGG